MTKNEGKKKKKRKLTRNDKKKRRNRGVEKAKFKHQK